jgi:photosystem II stability/assembly factor-like uncharacterized protein
MFIARLLLNVAFILISAYCALAQHVALINSENRASFRGLSVVNDKVIWVSGSKGTVGISTNNGNSWHFLVVQGFENRDFRDIEAFDGATAVIMAVGEPAVILRTTNAGTSWKTVYENNTPGMFLDAMEFWNEESGIVLGDPVKGRFFITRTYDGGHTWKDISFDKLPVADPAEACFAASGTNVRAFDRNEACFVSGGSRSRLFWRGTSIVLPVLQGKKSQGANSLAVWHRGSNSHQIIVVGGDFKADSSRTGNCTLSRDGGKSWIRPSNPPYGYRSCVEFISETKLVCCGITGVDISLDEGINWNNISATGFHVCRKSKKGDAVFLAGEEGRIGRLIF